MKRIGMNVKKREATGKRHGRALRRQGLIPAVVYGAEGPNVPVTVDDKGFRISLRAGSANAILELKVEGEDEETLAIIKDIQYDALGDEIQHVDFLRVKAGIPIQVTIPITATGRSEGENEGGVVEYLVREIRVECLPRDIPENVTYDLSPLALDDSLHLKDVAPPAGVTFLDPEDMALVVVKAPRMARADIIAEEEAAAAAAAAAEEAAEGEEGEAAEEGEEKAPPPAEETSS
jgi:large subunit ribosomal protein L25